MKVSAKIMQLSDELKRRVEEELEQRAEQANAELMAAAKRTLGKRGKGQRYRIPGSRRRYRASMPKAPPAKRTGALAASWSTQAVKYKPYSESLTVTKPGITTGMDELAKTLTKGAVRKRGGLLVRRPFKRKIQRSARRKVRRIYRQPYLQG